MDWWMCFCLVVLLLGLFLIGGTSVVGNDFVEWKVEFCVFPLCVNKASKHKFQ